MPNGIVRFGRLKTNEPRDSLPRRCAYTAPTDCELSIRALARFDLRHRSQCAFGELAILRAHAIDLINESLMHFWDDRVIYDFRSRGLMCKRYAGLPIVRGPNGASFEATSTVRTHILTNGFSTLGAIRAFVGADARLRRIWR